MVAQQSEFTPEAAVVSLALVELRLCTALITHTPSSRVSFPLKAPSPGKIMIDQTYVAQTPNGEPIDVQLNL